MELKDAPSNTVPNNSGLPPGFPREGAKKVFENSKVNVWNYTWLPGKPTVMHFHNTEIIVVYLGNGDVAATTPDGKRTVTHRNPGDIVFNTAPTSSAVCGGGGTSTTTSTTSTTSTTRRSSRAWAVIRSKRVPNQPVTSSTKARWKSRRCWPPTTGRRLVR